MQALLHPGPQLLEIQRPGTAICSLGQQSNQANAKPLSYHPLIVPMVPVTAIKLPWERQGRCCMLWNRRSGQN